MSALVSDTRAIGMPTSSTVDCPTMSSTGAGVGAGAGGGSSPRRQPPTRSARPPPRKASAPACRWRPTTAMIRMAAPRDAPGSFLSLTCHGVHRYSWRTTSCARLSPRMISDCRRRRGAGSTPAAAGAGRRRRSRSPGRRVTEQHRRPDARRGRRRLVERIAERQLNLAFRARQRQSLGFDRIRPAA